MRRKLLHHRVVMNSWGIMHLLLHVVVVVFVIVTTSGGISRIFITIVLHWFTRNMVTCLVSLHRFLNRRDNILEQFILDRFSVKVRVFEVKITTIVSSNRRWILGIMAVMIHGLRLI